MPGPVSGDDAGTVAGAVAIATWVCRHGGEGIGMKALGFSPQRGYRGYIRAILRAISYGLGVWV